MSAIDPRRGVPSASSIHRVAMCPPSHQMAMLAGDNSGKWSKFGDAIHEALAKLDYSMLDEDQLETFGMCLEQSERILREWLGDEDVTFQAHRDSKRLGLTCLGGVVEVTDETTAPVINTGLADIIAIKETTNGREFLIIDYKTLRGEVPEAADNDQLRNLAVLVAKFFKAWRGRVAIVQPWSGKPTVADYNREALDASADWLKAVLEDEGRSTPADRHAGDWCHWCPAKERCEVFRETTLAPVERMSISLPADDKTARAALFARAMELPADLLAAYKRGLRMVAWYVDAIEGAAKTRAKDDVEFQQFYHLEEGDEVREVTDTGAVFGLLQPHGLTEAALLEKCVTIKVGELDKAIHKASGPNIKKDGTPGTRYKITGDEASKIVTQTLMAAGALKMKRNAEKLVEGPKLLEESK